MTLLRSGAQGAQKLREQRIAVFFRYLEQAHVRMAPDVAGERGVGFFLHHAEDGNGSVQKRPDARGIALGVPLHAADLVHQNEVAVLRALQRGKPCRLKCIRKRCDAERRMADADAVIFAPGWRDARGCRVERLAAAEYGVPIIDGEG